MVQSRSTKKKKTPASTKVAVKKTLAQPVVPVAPKVNTPVQSDKKNKIHSGKQLYKNGVLRDILIFALGMLCMAFIAQGIYTLKKEEKPIPHARICRFAEPLWAQQTCAPTVERRARYIPAEYEPYLKRGANKIKGRVDMEWNMQKRLPRKTDMRRTGESIHQFKKRIKPVEKNRFQPIVRQAEVFANPMTSYSREWFTRNWAGTENLTQPDARALKTVFRGWIGPDGTFELNDLPNGEYFVVARACVQFRPNQPCREVRYGKRVRAGDKKRTVLEQVYSAK